MQSRLSVILDTLFLSFLSLLISFACFKTFITNSIICWILAIIIFALCIYITLPKSINSWNKKYANFSEHKHIEKCRFALQTMKNEDILSFFNKLFEKHYNVKTDGDYLIIDDKSLVCFDYLSDKLEKRFVLDAYIKACKIGLTEVAIFTEKQNIETVKYAENLSGVSIFFFDHADTYSLMKRFNYFPVSADTKITSKPFSNLKNMTLSKKKARSFLFTSFLLYFSSLFIPFTSYYLIFAGISLILSIVCFAKNEPKTEPKQAYILQTKTD